MSLTQNELNAIFAVINERTAIDAEFRNLCIEKPNEAIRLVSGKEVPDGVKIKIIENSPGYDYTHVLPDFTEGELSEDDISHVSGGAIECYNGGLPPNIV